MKVRHRGIERKPALALVKLDCRNLARKFTPAWPIPISASAVVPLTTYSSLKSYAQLHLILSAFDPDIATEVEATSNPALLEREDCTLLAWYRSFTHPRTGGRRTVTIGRRELLAALGSVAAAWPLAARAQQGERVRRVGLLQGSPRATDRPFSIRSTP